MIARAIASVRWRAALLLPLLSLVIVPGAGCADQQGILFHNHLDRAMTVHIDGDRLLILRPGVTEGIPYATAAWAWPRTIEVRDYVTGDLHMRLVADATDLIQYRWLIDIR
jgi:hypothetical protein